MIFQHPYSGRHPGQAGYENNWGFYLTVYSCQSWIENHCCPSEPYLKTSFCYLSCVTPHQLPSRFLWVTTALPGMCFSWELSASSPTETVCMKNSFASNLCSIYFIKASACMLNQHKPQMGGFRQSAARLGRKPNIYPAYAFLNEKKFKNPVA